MCGIRCLPSYEVNVSCLMIGPDIWVDLETFICYKSFVSQNLRLVLRCLPGLAIQIILRARPLNRLSTHLRI